MPVNWNYERQKLHATYARAATALNFMRREAKVAGKLSAEAQWAATQRDEMQQARALPIAAKAYNARINAEASRYEAAYFLVAQDLRERGLEQASTASMVNDALKRQPLMTSAETNVRAADVMEEAAIAAGRAARDKAPPLSGEFANNPQEPNNDMAMGTSYGWRPREINELMSPFYPADVKRASGGLGVLGQLGATDWWESFKKALGAGAAAAGNEASKQGKQTAEDDPAAKAALTASGGTLQWLSTLLGADYQASERQPAPSAFPWAPVLIGAGVVGVGAVLFFSLRK